MWVRKRRSEDTALDMTPLVDVVFLLIIFFMLSTTFIVLPGIRIDLPKASSEKLRLEKQELVLTVDKTGVIYIDGEPVNSEQLAKRLHIVYVHGPETLVLIKGDRGSQYGRIVDLLGLVRQSRLHRIAIVTQKKDKPLTKEAIETK